MEQHTRNLKFQRQRKFLMVLPLLVLPFITLMFWALGGGKTIHDDLTVREKKGFNTSLPDPHLKEDMVRDKLSYYEKAASDSAKFRALLKKDPFYNRPDKTNKETQSFESFFESELKFKTGEERQSNLTALSPASQSPNEAKVYKKLERLNAALKQTSTLPEEKSLQRVGYSPPAQKVIDGPDIQSLENRMEQMGQRGGVDPELDQLNSMLEKVLDIQHPDRVQERLQALSKKRSGQVYAVSLKTSRNPVSTLDRASKTAIQDRVDLQSTPGNPANGFYSFGGQQPDGYTANAIEAVVHETQTLTSGSTLKFRLLSDVYIEGILIPKDNFIFGVVSLNGERLHVKINTVRYENLLFPVTLAVHDLDGLNGIYIPGAISREVAKQSTDRAVQSFGLTAFDPSFGEQAAAAGIDAAQNLLSKKVKLVKVMVKAGYKVLLLDEKQRHEMN